MNLQPLLDRARAGDRAAWNQLLGELRPLVRAWLRRSLRQDGDASDLTNEVQFRMHRGFARFRGETTGQLRVWTLRITLNVLHDHRRSKRPAPARLPESLAFPSPVTPVADGDEMIRLHQALEQLPRHYRAVIEGRLFDGLSCVEIAEQMNELPGTVRMWCYRAVNELNQRLGPRS
jgi:RNA polymerase sigma-70 factor (ECF subfamily)